jgi:hypothetical protein
MGDNLPSAIHTRFDFVDECEEVVHYCTSYANQENFKRDNLFTWNQHFAKCLRYFILTDIYLTEAQQIKLVEWTKTLNCINLDQADSFAKILEELNKLLL